MGTKERRERERQEIRASILSAARQIAIEEGWQMVTTRKVAERIEYSQPTIYEYFANKEAILNSLVHEGFEQMLATMQAAKAQHGQPEAQFYAISRAYYRFAFSCPELYQVMYGFGGVSFTHADTPDEARAAFALLRETLLAWTEQEHVTLSELDALVDSLWAAVHGLIVLTMAGRIAGGEERSKRILDQIIADLLHAWRDRS